MTDQRPTTPDDDEYWRRFLTEGDPAELAKRRLFRWLPHGPRCGMCHAPFGGPGSMLMRAVGKRPSQQNPAVCTSCFAHISARHGGAEIDMTLLFADIRGSTAIAERMSPTEFRELLDRFYVAAGEAIFGSEGSIDKFVGDEVVAFFVPGFISEKGAHARRAVEAAARFLRLTGHDSDEGPWVPIGVGIHTGRAWMGAVGEGPRTELTAVGDTVNTAARLAAAAVAGEILLSSEAAREAQLHRELPRSSIELKGKAAPLEVVHATLQSLAGWPS